MSERRSWIDHSVTPPVTAVPPRPAAPDAVVAQTVDSAYRCESCRERFTSNLQRAQHNCPAAPDATAGDGLREVLIEDVKTALDAAYQYSSYRWPQQQDCSRIADDLLGGHALRDVLAAAARDAEKVRRVEELPAEFARMPSLVGSYAAERIRRALDGTP